MDPCLQICHLLKQACALSEKHLGKSLGDTNLNLSQAMMLVCLADGDASSMSYLGKQLCCHKSNVTQIVDFLIEEGLIERVACKQDRRVQCIALTEKGRKIVDHLHKSMAAGAEECLQELSNSEAKEMMKMLTNYIRVNSKETVVV